LHKQPCSGVINYRRIRKAADIRFAIEPFDGQDIRRFTVQETQVEIGRAPLSFALYRWKIEFCDFAKAIRFGAMRARNKSSTHLRVVPSRLNPETERLFRFDVSRREILH
jgi:hypothetical protein